jgi:hypothetical protein
VNTTSLLHFVSLLHVVIAHETTVEEEREFARSPENQGTGTSIIISFMRLQLKSPG